jgi:aminopeptidase
MKDPRFTKLAKTLVQHSMQVKPGDKVLVEAFDIPTDFTVEFIDVIVKAGGLPLVSTYHQPVLRAMFKHATEAQMKTLGKVEKLRMQSVDCYAGLRGSHNIAEMSDVPKDRMEIYEKHWWNEVHSKIRVPKTRWVVLRWPTPSMAQNAGMSTEAFEDFYFDVCAGVNYGKMAKAAEPLADLMRKTDKVEIKGPGETHLTFSIKGIGAEPCNGDRNIPDGECYSCPTLDSCEGVVKFNAETLYRGTVFNGIRLVMKKGKVVEATADSKQATEKLNDILDADKGARYIGEWSLGYNPLVTKPMRDILFDEKIAGSFHFTPGKAYEGVGNGNKSQIHWDMVCIQRPEFGGGTIEFDGKLVRKDGLFVPKILQGLNPDRLSI